MSRGFFVYASPLILELLELNVSFTNGFGNALDASPRASRPLLVLVMRSPGSTGAGASCWNPTLPLRVCLLRFGPQTCLRLAAGPSKRTSSPG